MAKFEILTVLGAVFPHFCPDKREIWHGPLPRAKFHVYWGRNMGIQPPKLTKFRILVINLPLRGHSFAQFLRNSQILYASIGSF